MQREFVRQIVRTGDYEYAATKAGYSQPAVAGWKLMQHELIKAAEREAVSGLLRDKLGPASIMKLAEIGFDDLRPAGAQVKALTYVADRYFDEINGGSNGKELHEMTADELRNHLASLSREKQAAERAMADQARPILEHEAQEDSPKTDVFG